MKFVIMMCAEKIFRRCRRLAYALLLFGSSALALQSTLEPKIVPHLGSYIYAHLLYKANAGRGEGLDVALYHADTSSQYGLFGSGTYRGRNKSLSYVGGGQFSFVMRRAHFLRLLMFYQGLLATGNSYGRIGGGILYAVGHFRVEAHGYYALKVSVYPTYDYDKATFDRKTMRAYAPVIVHTQDQRLADLQAGYLWRGLEVGVLGHVEVGGGKSGGVELRYHLPFLRGLGALRVVGSAMLGQKTGTELVLGLSLGAHDRGVNVRPWSHYYERPRIASIRLIQKEEPPVEIPKEQLPNFTMVHTLNDLLNAVKNGGRNVFFLSKNTSLVQDVMLQGQQTLCSLQWCDIPLKNGHWVHVRPKGDASLPALAFYNAKLTLGGNGSNLMGLELWANKGAPVVLQTKGGSHRLGRLDVVNASLDLRLGAGDTLMLTDLLHVQLTGNVQAPVYVYDVAWDGKTARGIGGLISLQNLEKGSSRLQLDSSFKLVIEQEDDSVLTGGGVLYLRGPWEVGGADESRLIDSLVLQGDVQVPCLLCFALQQVASAGVFRTLAVGEIILKKNASDTTVFWADGYRDGKDAPDPVENKTTVLLSVEKLDIQGDLHALMDVRGYGGTTLAGDLTFGTKAWTLGGNIETLIDASGLWATTIDASLHFADLHIGGHISGAFLNFGHMGTLSALGHIEFGDVTIDKGVGGAFLDFHGGKSSSLIGDLTLGDVTISSPDGGTLAVGGSLVDFSEKATELGTIKTGVWKVKGDIGGSVLQFSSVLHNFGTTAPGSGSTLMGVVDMAGLHLFGDLGVAVGGSGGALLNFTNAYVGGYVFLRDVQFGTELKPAHIKGGSLLGLDGANLDWGSKVELDFQTLHVDLDEMLLEAYVTQLNGLLKVQGKTPLDVQFCQNTTSVKDACSLLYFHDDGTTNRETQIGGTVELSDVKIRGIAANQAHNFLGGWNVKVLGNVQVGNVSMEGEAVHNFIFLSGDIEGRFVMKGISLKNMDIQDGGSGKFQFSGLAVGGLFSLGDLTLNAVGGGDSHLISLHNATINGEFQVGDVRLSDVKFSSKSILKIDDTEIGGTVVFNNMQLDAETGKSFQALVFMQIARGSGNIHFGNVTVKNMGTGIHFSQSSGDVKSWRGSIGFGKVEIENASSAFIRVADAWTKGIAAKVTIGNFHVANQSGQAILLDVVKLDVVKSTEYKAPNLDVEVKGDLKVDSLANETSIVHVDYEAGPIARENVHIGGDVSIGSGGAVKMVTVGKAGSGDRVAKVYLEVGGATYMDTTSGILNIMGPAAGAEVVLKGKTTVEHLVNDSSLVNAGALPQTVNVQLGDVVLENVAVAGSVDPKGILFQWTGSTSNSDNSNFTYGFDNFEIKSISNRPLVRFPDSVKLDNFALAITQNEELKMPDRAGDIDNNPATYILLGNGLQGGKLLWRVNNNIAGTDQRVDLGMVKAALGTSFGISLTMVCQAPASC